MKLIDRAKSWLGIGAGAQEGSWRGPFMGFGEFGSPMQLGETEDGWQRGLNISNSSAANVPIVYACVMAQARAVSLCYATHRKVIENGSHKADTESWVARLLRNPNDYLTWPQFILNVVAEMLFKGESIVMIVRDNRFVPVALHRIQHGSWQARISEDGEVFYTVSNSGNPLAPSDLDYAIPSRDVIHFRQHTPRHPLVGESPITSAALAIGINVSLSKSQAAFFSQMRRPSGILSTDQVLTTDQLRQLRKAFDEQSQRLASGGIPILASGLKFQGMSITSQDAQLVEAQRMSVEDICRVFGVPPPIVSDLSHATLNNAESLINHWLALGLGSLLENIERSFDKAFGFGAKEYVELDTAAILRSDFVSRVEGLTKSIQGGLLSVNEAREREGLPRVENGDEPMVQQQMVTVSYAASQKADAPGAAPAPAEPKPAPEAKPEAAKGIDYEITKALVVDLIQAKKRKAA